MNQKQTPGYVMMVMTFAIMVIAFAIALSGGKNPSNRDILNAVVVIGAGLAAIIGYFVTLLWDKLNMLSDLYTILTGDNQDELAGTLQRLRNTVAQGIRNMRWGLSAIPSGDPTSKEREEINA